MNFDKKAAEFEKMKEEFKEEIDELFALKKDQSQLAKDGKPFDIDNIRGPLESGEVEVIQYLRPDGKRRRMAAQVGLDIARKAENLILSSEDLRSGKIAIWCRRVGEDEEQERILLADNGPGENSPTNVLIRLIEEFAADDANRQI